MGKIDFPLSKQLSSSRPGNEYAGSDQRRIKLIGKGYLPCSSRISASGKVWHLAGEEAIA
ncbi:MAG: hypothetical protein E4H23_07105 [Chrysiogenales bacterium]|nr:MAG: hypothetical protein E4H23_07105 [Chrysiogenales bacterium]